MVSVALVPGPLSPEEPCKPVPTTVLMRPVVLLTFRMRLLPRSAMYTLPHASTATPVGKLIPALLLWPPSPQKAQVPFPTTVLMVPQAGPSPLVGVPV